MFGNRPGLRYAVIALAVASVTATVAQADPAETRYLQEFTGDWRGQGVVQLTPRSQPEEVICRAAGVADDRARLEISGRCGGETFTATFRISANYDTTLGAYRATFAGPPSVGSSQMIGYRDGDRLEFELRHPGQPLSFMTIRRDGDGTFRISVETTTGQRTPPYTSASVALMKE